MADFSRTTEVIIPTSDGSVGMSVNGVLQWVEPNMPPQEAMKFLMICRSIGLNPFLKEVYPLEVKGKWTTIIAKGGYLKVAQRHRNRDGDLDFGGHEAGIVVREKMVDPRTGAVVVEKSTGTPAMKGPPVEVEGGILPQGFLLVGGYAKVWRSGVARPFKASVSLAEYDQNNHTWQRLKCTMIRKVALVHAIREAFAIGDCYDEGEFGPNDRVRKGSVRAAVAPPEGPPGSPGGIPELEELYADSPDPICPPDLVKAIEDIRVRNGKDERWLQSILVRRGYSGVAALSVNDAAALIRKLEEAESRGDFLDRWPHGTGDRGPSLAYAGPGRPLDEEMVVPGGAAPVGGGTAVLEAGPVGDSPAGETRPMPPTGGPEDDDAAA